MHRIIFIFCFILFGCGYLISNKIIEEAVEKQGYTNVSIINRSIIFSSWKGCRKKDSIVFDILATNINGKRIGLVVCAGWPFKGVVIRSR